MPRRGFPSGLLSDEALLSGMAAGDHDATVAFVRRFQSKVYGLALTILGDPATAEDVAQRAFERAWRHAAMYDPRRGSARTWLSTITRNLAIDAGRVPRGIPVDPESLTTVMVSLTDNPESRALGSERAELVRAALRQLPLEQARAVTMASIYGMTCAEVAEIEGIPVGTVKTRVHAAMRKLRVALVEEGSAP
ncbi:MAG TPA: sigma-70 family RNA polymerase sigma factor [Acidimicrobiales bacterium]|nr:sigma-70 family RNA polymerase sigma factor [Acidimicrobiales bacterium]